MEELFFNIINQFGYFAVGALIFIENIFPPIPSELILPLSGFFTTTTDMALPLVIFSATVGSVTGAFILYGIGYVLNRERLMRFFNTRPMRLLGFKDTDISSAIDWFDRKGQASVLICRCIPVVRSLISIPAGVARMNIVKFSLFTLVGSAVWNTILCSLGAAAGSAWETVTAQAEWVSGVVKIVIIAIVAVVAIWWIVKRIIPNLKREGANDARGRDDKNAGNTHKPAHFK
ncbi:MAG TPA: DedA family protein [Candidatus Limicola stercorigallinarum]|nr:DedA family protein [Candidatus Limicola stercorigallinarum]